MLKTQSNRETVQPSSSDARESGTNFGPGTLEWFAWLRLVPALLSKNQVQLELLQVSAGLWEISCNYAGVVPGAF